MAVLSRWVSGRSYECDVIPSCMGSSASPGALREMLDRISGCTLDLLNQTPHWNQIPSDLYAHCSLRRTAVLSQAWLRSPCAARTSVAMGTANRCRGILLDESACLDAGKDGAARESVVANASEVVNLGD